MSKTTAVTMPGSAWGFANGNSNLPPPPTTTTTTTMTMNDMLNDTGNIDSNELLYNPEDDTFTWPSSLPDEPGPIATVLPPVEIALPEAEEEAAIPCFYSDEPGTTYATGPSSDEPGTTVFASSNQPGTTFFASSDESVGVRVIAGLSIVASVVFVLAVLGEMVLKFVKSGFVIQQQRAGDRGNNPSRRTRRHVPYGHHPTTDATGNYGGGFGGGNFGGGGDFGGGGGGCGGGGGDS